MSRTVISRCENCHDKYLYYASGGAPQAYNSSTYCPTCERAVQDSLAQIPKRYRRAWRCVSDVSLETLVALHDQKEAHRKMLGKSSLLPYISSSPARLYDLTNPYNINQTGYVSTGDHNYKFSYWTQDGLVGNVYLEVEEDVATGCVMGPWDLSQHWDKMPTFCDEKPRGVHPPTHELIIKPLPTPEFKIFHMESVFTDPES